jgi:drug/metabolite transporter (DMT)-like permease
MGKHARTAVALLAGTGCLVGTTFPLGKLAARAGVPPPSWAWSMATGSGVLLLAFALVTRRGVPVGVRYLRYYAVAAAISFVAPNVLVFAAIPRLGAGFTSVMLALSPVLTLALSALLGLRRPDRLGVAGIATGLVGALLIALSRGEVGRPADAAWVALALLIPAFLAAGNVYRTVDWPEGADPLALAVGTNLAAAAMLLVAVLAFDGARGIESLADVPGLVTAQALAGAAMLALFFRLQEVGGPVFLSQIGYVAAAVGLVSGTALLGERYAAATWAGALVVVAGVALVARSQAKEAT